VQKDGVEPVPSESSVYRALRRARLIDEKARRKKIPTYKRWVRCRSMELWQMDVVGSASLAAPMPSETLNTDICIDAF
jgi:hypothetical protein